MNKKMKSKLFVGTTALVMVTSLASAAFSASATIDHGGFAVQAVDQKDSTIVGISGMAAKVNPENPENPGAPSHDIPTLTNASHFYPLSVDRISNVMFDVNDKGVVSSGIDSEIFESTIDSKIFEFEGMPRPNVENTSSISVRSYDTSGNPIASTSWSEGDTIAFAFWKKSGNGYKFLGKLVQSNKDAQAFSMMSPNGTFYHGIADNDEIKIYRNNASNFELFRTIPVPAGNGRVAAAFAISDSGTVSFALNNERLFVDSTRTVKIAIETLDASPLPNGGFALGTRTGITLVNDSGTVTSTKDFGKSVSKLLLGANGITAYELGVVGYNSGQLTEIRTFDSAGKDTLWAYGSYDL